MLETNCWIRANRAERAFLPVFNNAFLQKNPDRN